jgi:hypothetical protein
MLGDSGIAVRLPKWSSNVSVLHAVQAGSGVQPAPYSKDIRVFFCGIKRAEREADYSYISSTEVTNAWMYTSTAWRLMKCR